jgi:hypothetical protein
MIEIHKCEVCRKKMKIEYILRGAYKKTKCETSSRLGRRKEYSIANGRSFFFYPRYVWFCKDCLIKMKKW